MYTCTYTHTHIHIYTYTYTHTHIHIHIVHIQIYTYTYTCTHTRTLIHTNTPIHRYELCMTLYARAYCECNLAASILETPSGQVISRQSTFYGHTCMYTYTSHTHKSQAEEPSKRALAHLKSGASIFAYIANSVLPLKEGLPYDRPPEVSSQGSSITYTHKHTYIGVSSRNTPCEHFSKIHVFVLGWPVSSPSELVLVLKIEE